MGRRRGRKKSNPNKKRQASRETKTKAGQGRPGQGDDVDNHEGVDIKINVPQPKEPGPSSAAAASSSILTRAVIPEVELKFGNYNAEHEAAIKDRVLAVNFLASKTAEISTSFYKCYGPTTQVLESYNHFMNHILPAILTRNGYFEHEEIIDARMNIRRIHRVRIVEAVLEGTNTQIRRETRDGEYYVLYPHEARTRGLTYSRKLIAKFTHEVVNKDSAGGMQLIVSGTDRMPIGDIPIMVKSEFCSLYGFKKDELVGEHEDPDDPGGYFIIKGKEKVLIGQERTAHNQIFIFKAMSNAAYQLEAEVRSSVDLAAEEVSAFWIRLPGRPVSISTSTAERRSPEEKHFQLSPFVNSSHIKPIGTLNYIHKHKPLLEKKFQQKNRGLMIYHTSLQKPFPLYILYKALGFIDDKSIWETFGLPVDGELGPMFRDALQTTMDDETAKDIETQRDAIIHIGKLKKQRASEQYLDREAGIRRVFTEDDHHVRGLHFINEEVLPHIGTGNKSSDVDLKAYHVGYIVNRLIQAHLGLIPCDDRDHLQNKRFDLPGPLISNLLKKLLSCMMEDMRQRVARKVDNKRKYDFFTQIAGTSTLTQGFQYSFSTGNWGDRRMCSAIRVGVSQPLNRLTGIATISFLRRINAPLSRLSRMIIPRNVHNTAFGYICPMDTPEGEPVGFLKNLAIMAQVSVDADSTPILKCLSGFKFRPLNAENLHRLAKETKIFINATLIGTITSGPEPGGAVRLVNKLKCLRMAWDKDKYNKFTAAVLEIQRQKLMKSKRKGLEPPGLTCLDVSTDVMNQLGYQHMMSNQISITHDVQLKEIRIRTDGGRPLRPLYLVEQNLLKLRDTHIQGLLPRKDDYGADLDPTVSWNDLVRDGIVEFIDAAEEENAYIAMYPKKLMHSIQPVYRDGIIYQDHRSTSYTHCEIDPAGILGVVASIVPFANHSQGPRLTFQTNIAKQAVGVYALNYASRFDTDSHVLMYGGQRPLVTSKAAAAFSKFDENPAGQNAIVAILTYTGYNQEDSLIMNKSSIQRGLFRSIHFKVKDDVEIVNTAFGDQDEMFELPIADETGINRDLEVACLDTDGLPVVGIEIKDGYLVIGKTQLIPKNEQEQNSIMGRKVYIKRDVSQMYRVPCYSSSYYDNTGPKSPCNPSRTLVDHVAIFDNDDGYRSCKVRLRSIRCPQIGDKFSSRHGQKGVMGISLDECDMPFTKDGIVPDIIINPHAIPSRMTIGHILEMLDAKVATFRNRISDRPPFSTSKDFDNCDGKDVTVELGEQLKKRGFNSTGFEVMYCGHTGRKITTTCFIGPCFYQRLKHMTEDKLRFRARGPVSAMARQPNPGLSREGGLRFGEMERDSAVAHGGMQFLRERLFLVSDYYLMTICQRCGQPLTQRTQNRNMVNLNHFANYKCTFCKSSRDRGTLIELPYATKLMFQELMCMNIKVMLHPDNAGTNPIVSQEPPRKTITYDSNNHTTSVLDDILTNSEDITKYFEPIKPFPNPKTSLERLYQMLSAKPGGEVKF